MAVTKRVFKGSGYMFVRKHDKSKEYPAVADMTKMSASEAAAVEAFVKELATAENEIGYLKGGYTFAEEITPLSDQDDMGRLKIDEIQDETATSTFSLFNANGATIEKLHPLGKSAYEETSGVRLTNLGGIANRDDAEYDILFVHPDTAEGDICIYSLGKNVSGLTLAFSPDAVTPLPCSYAAQAIDSTGVLAKISEHKPGTTIFDPATVASGTSLADQV